MKNIFLRSASFRRIAALALLESFLCLATVPSVRAADKISEPGFSADLTGSQADVQEAVESVVNDTIIHGTYVYDREKTLGGAEAIATSKVFPPWTAGGKIYFKACYKALSPRNFRGSEDQGTITVRYILQDVSPGQFRIHIDAVFIEDERRAVHPSEGIVESSEFKEITERLKNVQLQLQKNAESKARIDEQIAAKEELLRRRQEEATRLADAESSAQDLVARLQELRHRVEMRVTSAGAKVKSAPFEAAATLETLRPSTDVAVVILSQYWLGIETSDGHRGWVRKDALAPLP
jgi:hypothetical protein